MENGLTIRSTEMIRTYDDLMKFSDLLVKSGMLPQGVKTKEAAAVVILKGREIGMPMMESFSLINVIQGKPTIAPQGMIALARRTGLLEDMKLWSNEGNTESYCIVKRRGQSEYKSTFTDKDAEAMGLMIKDNWKKQKRVMREWRAASANFRITFADVIGGMYPPEELGAEVDDEGEVVQVDSQVVETTHVDPQPPVSVGTIGSDPTKLSAAGIVIPEALRVALKQYANKPFSNPEKRKGALGLAVGAMDDYAGDPQRRRSFSLAMFGKESSREWTDNEIWALVVWKDHPNAKAEVNRVINDWMKLQGQTELFGEPATA